MLKRLLVCAAFACAPLTAVAQVSGGIAPSAAGKSLAVTSSSGCIAMTGQNTSIVVWNVGANAAYFNVNGAVATTGNPQLPAGGAITLSIPAGATLCAITASSTTTLQITQGFGFASITGGGGSGGGGGGGAVTMASGAVASGAYSAGSLAAGAGVDGWDLTQGALADAAATAGSTGSISAKLRLMTSQLNTISTNTGAAIPAGSNLIGKVGIDQTTPGTTNAVSATNFPTTVSTGTGAQGASSPRVTVATDQATNAGAALVKGGVGVVNGGSFYQAVAASQTATVLQSSTGATGDYLSHCVLYPTSTSPGVVTVFDNTNAAAGSAILFPGGASSLSNLAPIAIPVGALSTAGAWKVTTGASISVVCYGKFS